MGKTEEKLERTKEIAAMFEEPLCTPEEAREWVRSYEAEGRRLNQTDRNLVRTYKTVAEAYDHVRSLRNHSRALRERIQELNREAGL